MNSIFLSSGKIPSDLLWAELAARSRTENLRPGAGGMSNSWGMPVHLPSCQNYTHSPGFIPKSPRTWFPERQTGEPCTTQAYALLRSWFFCQSSATLLADGVRCQVPTNIPAALPGLGLLKHQQGPPRSSNIRSSPPAPALCQGIAGTAEADEGTQETLPKRAQRQGADLWGSRPLATG